MGQLPCFEELRKLAESDPEAFEAYREQICEQFIDSIPRPHRQRLRAVQFRVNHVIHRAKTPMAGLIQVSGMMHDSLRSLSFKLYELGDAPGQHAESDARQADVIDMKSWQQHHNGKQH